jgi:hypothetical protein
MSILPVDISPSFVALREAVRDLEARGRVTRLAGIKPELRRRLPGFDERQQGFRSFGEFCEAAAKSGVIRLMNDEEGWARATVDDQATSSTREPGRLRRDIWQAFTQWGEGWVRCWDRATSRAVRLSESPRANEPVDHASLRDALAANDGSVISIEPIAREVQSTWMDEFVQSLGDHQLARPLMAALEDPRPFRAFTAVLNADDVLRRRFSQMRLLKVLEVVRGWAAANGVDLDALDHSAEPPKTSKRVPRPASTRASDEDLLRRALTLAAAEMSVDDLRHMWIPAGYVLDALR